MKARCQYSQWTCAQGSFNMHLVGKPPKMETVQYIQLMTSMRFTLRGAGVTGDAYFGRFRKSWYINRLQLLTVAPTHLKPTLIVCVIVQRLDNISVDSASSGFEAAPAPTARWHHYRTTTYTYNRLRVQINDVSSKRSLAKSLKTLLPPINREHGVCVSVFWINRAGVVSVSNSLQSSIGR